MSLGLKQYESPAQQGHSNVWLAAWESHQQGYQVKCCNSLTRHVWGVEDNVLLADNLLLLPLATHAAASTSKSSQFLHAVEVK